MNNTQSIISKKVMLRVKSVYYLRKVLNRFVLKSVALYGGALAFGSLVHVAKVFENMPHYSDIAAFTQFSLAAFLSTEIMVQAVILAAMGITLWLARDVIMTIVGKVRTPSLQSYSHAS